MDLESIQVDTISAVDFVTALKKATVQIQNDTFRKAGPLPDENIGRWVMTHGIDAEGPAFVTKVVEAVRTFDAFDEDADPYGTHEMGSFQIEGKTVWFKLDLYDESYEYGSPEPTDVAQTRRVLTILFPHEY